MVPSETTRCERCGHESSAEALFCAKCGVARARLEGDPMVGKVVADRYLLRERLGHGGSGVIYRAEHVTLRRTVAVKVLHEELCRDDLAIERFRREATTVGQIDNEHIVAVHDFGRTGDGRLFLAMELLEGATLADTISAEGRLVIAKVVDVLTQLGEALMEAHAMGYVHRDLRPRNIFLARRRGREGFVKLLDFGLAKLVEREGEAVHTSLGMTFGDPRYMSPEQAQGNQLDRRADIYSLGCIAYEMLTATPPFVGKKVFDVLTAHVEEAPTPPSRLRPDVPAWLDAVVLRALAKRPEERFLTVYRLIEALRQGQTTGAIMSDEVARSQPSLEAVPAKDPTAPPGPGAPRSAEASGAWYADGPDEEDRAGHLGQAASKQSQPPVPDAGTSSAWRDPSQDPERRKKLLILSGSAAAVLIGLLAVAFWPSGKEKQEPVATAAKTPAVAAASPDATPTMTSSDAGLVALVPATRRPESALGLSPGPNRERVISAPTELLGPKKVDAGAAKDESSAEAAQADFYVKLGRQALGRGDANVAAANFNKAREFNPRNAEAICGLGEVAFSRGQLAEAVVHLERAAQLAPAAKRSSRIHALLGQAYLSTHRPKPAVQAYRKALELDPENGAARRGYEEAAARSGP